LAIGYPCVPPSRICAFQPASKASPASASRRNANFQGYLWSLVPNWTNGVPVIGGNVIFNQGTLHGESALRAAPAEVSSVAIGRITDPGSSVGSVFSRRRL
jgi:hypothetical protein